MSKSKVILGDVIHVTYEPGRGCDGWRSLNVPSQVTGDVPPTLGVHF